MLGAKLRAPSFVDACAVLKARQGNERCQQFCQVGFFTVEGPNVPEARSKADELEAIARLEANVIWKMMFSYVRKKTTLSSQEQ